MILERTRLVYYLHNPNSIYFRMAVAPGARPGSLEVSQVPRDQVAQLTNEPSEPSPKKRGTARGEERPQAAKG